MATTVGQHSVAAFTSPVNGTTPIDANTVRGNDNTVRVAYVDHDADPGIHVQSSTLASRPAAGTAGRKWINSDYPQKLWYDDGTDWHEVGGDAITVYCKATETIAKGDIVKVTGYNTGQDVPEIAKVSSASDVAFGIAETAIANGSLGYVINTGIIQGVATNSFSLGSILYPNTSGGLTATKPTSGTYQTVAYVLRAHASSGVLYVEFSAPRIVEASANTASTIVLRDASGNFSAGTITAGALTASGAVSAGSVTSSGLVTFASLKGTGATTVTDILNDGTMATASATTLATSSSIKTYVDTKVATVDTLAEVLANGNTTGATDIVVSAGQKIRTPAVAAQDGTASITIANSTGALTLNTALADSNLATIATAGKVSNSATTATALNTASAIVARDGSGNFTAGTITAALTGNASTATALQTARTINGTSFDGTANITVTAAAGTLTGNTLASGVTASSLTSVGTLTNLTVTNPISGSVTGSSGSTTGNAATATKLATARNINGVAFDGTADITVTAAAGTLTGSTLASGVTASSLTSVGTLSSLTVTNNITSSSGIISAGADFRLAGNSFTRVADLENGGGFGGGYNLLIDGATAKHDSTGAIAGYLYTSGGVLNLYTGSSQAAGTTATARLTIDASGNLAVDTNTLYVDAANNAVGIGTSNPNAYGALAVFSSGVGLHNNSTSGAAGINFYENGSGRFSLRTLNGSAGLSFYDTFNTAERARITSGGYFKASNNGTYDNATGEYHELYTSDANDVIAVARAANASYTGNGFLVAVDRNTTNNSYRAFSYYNIGASAFRFEVMDSGTVNNATGTYGTISDIKHKQDVIDAPSQWDDLKAVRFRKFRMKSDVKANPDAPYMLGVVAQELEQVSPGLIEEHPDFEEQEVTDEDGNVTTEKVQVGTTKSVKSSILLMKAAVALQEAMARIEALEARLEALEA